MKEVHPWLGKVESSLSPTLFHPTSGMQYLYLLCGLNLSLWLAGAGNRFWFLVTAIMGSNAVVILGRRALPSISGAFG